MPDGKDRSRTLTEEGIHLRDILVKKLIGYVGLNRACKAAAVYTHDALTLKDQFTYGNADRESLLLGLGRGIDVLKEAEG